MVFKINISPKPILHSYFPKHNKELCWALSVLGAALLNKYLRGKTFTEMIYQYFFNEIYATEE